MTSVLLAACGGEDLPAAPSAGSDACASALAAAPERVLGAARAAGDTAGAQVYGEVRVRCGLEPLAPTTQECLDVNGQDWVLTTAADADPLVLVTYGRDPAVEVRVTGGQRQQDASAALVDLAPLAAALPSNGRSCVG